MTLEQAVAQLADIAFVGLGMLFVALVVLIVLVCFHIASRVTR